LDSCGLVIDLPPLHPPPFLTLPVSCATSWAINPIPSGSVLFSRGADNNRPFAAVIDSGISAALEVNCHHPLVVMPSQGSNASGLVFHHLDFPGFFFFRHNFFPCAYPIGPLGKNFRPPALLFFRPPWRPTRFHKLLVTVEPVPSNAAVPRALTSGTSLSHLLSCLEDFGLCFFPCHKHFPAILPVKTSFHDPRLRLFFASQKPPSKLVATYPLS